ncbi:DNA/RNA polymerases superfamily protein [Gossypium australe]|uniref:DNA/RNA polymerases superfamily protein n=1 Tax=Gossypium australe TaxID=47621 RepID=A0A5B6VCN8_9ROSI|nr:DNA/RNA polymerases superfamily protein [Gossypium australe]
MFAHLCLFDEGRILAKLQVKPSWLNEIKNKQLLVEFSILMRERFQILGSIEIIYVPSDVDLRQSILREANSSPSAIHPDNNKMYHDLRELYWWLGSKRGVIKFLSHCLTCQQVKAKHQFPSGVLQPVKILLWK